MGFVCIAARAILPAPQWQQQRAFRRAQRAAYIYALLFLVALFLVLIVGLWLTRGAFVIRRLP